MALARAALAGGPLAALRDLLPVRAALASWAWALLVTFSTVYVHVHCAVDVLAGLGLAAAVLLGAPAAARALGARRGPP